MFDIGSTEKRLSKPIEQLSFAIVTHSYIWGAAEELFDFLKGKAKKITIIKHPFYESKGKFSEVLVLNRGISKTSLIKPRLNVTLIDYMLDFVSSLSYFMLHKRTNVFIGADPLNTMVGLTLRKLRLTSTVIYYSVDYTPKRFDDTLLNWVYHYIDAICAVKSDYTWNLSSRYIDARNEKLRRLGFQSNGTQLLVRIPVREYKVREFSEIKEHGVIFSGSLRKEAGLDVILDAVQVAGQEISDLEVVIAGDGSIKDELTSQIRNQKLEKYVKISDYIASRKKFLDFLSTYAVGLAVYNPSKDTYAAYADVSKVKIYLACGLPVIISRHSYNAKEVESYKAGVLVDFDAKDVVRAFHELLDDQERYLAYRQNALKLAKEFDSEKIFSEAFKHLTSSAALAYAKTDA